MYTNKNFIEFYPELMTAEQKEVIEDNVAKRNAVFKEIEERTAKEFADPEFKKSRYNFRHILKREPSVAELEYKESNKKVEFIMSKVREDFFSKNSHLTFKSTEEAIKEILKESEKIFKWFIDVNNVKKNEGDIDNKYTRNYWYYMEWQSDLLPVADVIFALNDKKMPKDLPFKPEYIYQFFTVACGYSGISDKEMLLNRIFHSFETAVAWAFDSEEDWIMKFAPNSSQESFESHVNFWISLYNFVKNTEFKVETFDIAMNHTISDSFYVKPLFEKWGETEKINSVYDIPKIAVSAIDDMIAWIEEGKSIKASSGKLLWQKSKSEELGQIGMALALFNQVFPDNDFFNSEDFLKSINKINKYATSKQLYVYDPYYIIYGIFTALFDSLVYENEDYMIHSDVGIKVVQKFRAISEFLHGKQYFGPDATNKIEIEFDIEKAKEMIPSSVYTEEDLAKDLNKAFNSLTPDSEEV